PAFDSDGKRVLDGFLGDVDVPEHAHQHRDGAAVFLAKDLLDVSRGNGHMESVVASARLDRGASVDRHLSELDRHLGGLDRHWTVTREDWTVTSHRCPVTAERRASLAWVACHCPSLDSGRPSLQHHGPSLRSRSPSLPCNGPSSAVTCENWPVTS